MRCLTAGTVVACDRAERARGQAARSSPCQNCDSLHGPTGAATPPEDVGGRQCWRARMRSATPAAGSSQGGRVPLPGAPHTSGGGSWERRGGVRGARLPGMRLARQSFHASTVSRSAMPAPPRTTSADTRSPAAHEGQSSIGPARVSHVQAGLVGGSTPPPCFIRNARRAAGERYSSISRRSSSRFTPSPTAALTCS
jgi:hypothetical protein